MFDRDRFMKVLGGDPAKWANRYGIEPFTHPCRECGLYFTTSIPIARGTLRGLIAPVCECGNADTPYCVVSAKGDVLAELGGT